MLNVHLYCRDANGTLNHLGNQVVEHDNEEEAKRAVLNRFWDDRLDAADCSPVYSVSDLVPSEFDEDVL